MTSPYTGGSSYSRPGQGMDATEGVNSPIANAEWATFLQRRKQLLDEMLGSAVAPPGPVNYQRQAVAPDPNAAALDFANQNAPRPQARDEQIAQARFWQIQNPESINPQELEHMIAQRRAEVPRDEQTSVGSAAYAFGGGAAEAAGAFSHVLGNVLGLVKDIPFAGPTLAGVLRTEQAKNFMYDLSQKASMAVEAAGATQPAQDKSAYQFLTGAGKMAGYTLPAIAAWEGLGAVGNFAPVLAWGGRLTSPMLRAAIKGGLSAVALEGGSDESGEQKLTSIAFGSVLGGLMGAGGKIGAAAGMGVLGAGVGGAIGDTPEERTRHALEFGIGAAVLPMFAPILARAFYKVSTDLKTPFDQKFNDAAVLGKAQILENNRRLPPPPPGGGTQRADARVVTDPALHGGPDYEVLRQPQIGVRSTPDGEVISLEPGTSSNSLDSPSDRPRLMSPERSKLTEDLNYASELPWYESDLMPLPKDIRPQLYGLSPKPIPRTTAALINTKVIDPDTGMPAVVFHGTSRAYDEPAIDLSRESDDALFGPGYYTTVNPAIASEYAANGLGMDVTPNVRPMRLDIRNPYEVDRGYTWDEVSSLIDKLEEANPGYDWNASRELTAGLDVGAWAGGNYTTEVPDGQLHGEGIYNMLAMTPTSEPVQGPKLTSLSPTDLDPVYSDTENPGRTMVLGRAGLNRALKNAGYDGITHLGGGRIGNVRHQVWIAFSPEQIHSPWDVADLAPHEAVAQANIMTKQASIMESATLPEAVGKGKIDDSDVATAMKSSNPAGVSLIRGVDANQQTISKLLYEHPEIQFVQRGDKVDALLGNVSPAQIKSYEKYGMYEGQNVVHTDGTEGVLRQIIDGRYAMVEPLNGGPPKVRLISKLMAGRFGNSEGQAPDLYDQFKGDVLRYMNHEAAALDMAPVQDLTDPRVGHVLAERMDDFMDSKGITDPGMRQLVDQNLNRRWVEEFKALDPEITEIQNRAVDNAAVAVTESETGPNPIAVSLEEKANAKGFVWITEPGQGGTLRDMVNPEGALELPMDSDTAAHEFLNNVDRVLPDITPIDDVPVEVMDMVPTETIRDPRLGTEETAENLSTSYDRMLREDPLLAGMGGGKPPVEPPSGTPPADDGGFRALPGEHETLGGQFDRLRRSHPLKLAQMVHDFQGLLANKLRYTRYGMLNLEQKLTDLGVDMGRAWEHFENLATGRAKAFNESHQWLQQWGDVTRMFPRRVLRDGTVTRLHEIEDHNARMAAIWRLKDSHGLSDAQIHRYMEGDGQITAFMHKWFEYLSGDPAYAITAEREIFRYMPHVRAAQELGQKFDTSTLSPHVEYFAEHIRDGNIQLRIMDARDLGNHMIRAAMFKKHEAGPWEQMVHAWQDPRVPQSLQDYMMDYARLSRYGYNAEGELGVRGIKTVMKSVLGMPVTTAEAQHILNMPIGGMYMSLLAGRTSIFFRDAIQPLTALAKVRVGHMRGVYGDILRGKNANSLRGMYDRGLRAGWIEKENPNLEAGGIFEEQPDAASLELAGATPEQQARRELAARIGDKFFGLPNWLVRPTESNLSTLKLYGRQGQLHRLIAGESGYRQAATELQAYRKSILQAAFERNPDKAMSYEQLARRGMFDTFEPPIQRRLKELVDAGDDKGAAELFGREVANWSQFRYGKREMPPALRGEAGRLLFTFSNFSGQFLEGMMSAGVRAQAGKVRYWSTMGAITAALYEAKHLTGWSFDKWAYGSALGYTGGPLLEKALRTGEALIGGINMASDRPVSQTATAALKETADASLVPSLNDFNPWAGYVGSVAEYSAAAQGTNPIEQAARYTVTGDRGSGIDMQREIDRMMEAQYHDGPKAEGEQSPNGGTMQRSTSPFTDFIRRPQGYTMPQGYGPGNSGAGNQQ